MIYHTNKRFQMFLLHLTSKHTHWVTDECGFISHFKHEEVGQVDLMLREYLHHIDTKS